MATCFGSRIAYFFNYAKEFGRIINYKLLFYINLWHLNGFRFFECNYGTSGTPLDKIFGTFRDKLKEAGTSYKGGSEEKVDEKTVAIHDSKV